MTATLPSAVSNSVSRTSVSGSYLRVTLVIGPRGAMSQRPCSAVPSSAAKQAPESMRGAHHQSIEPLRSTSATVLVSPMMA